MSDEDQTLILARNVRLKTERCYECGHFWAYETRVGNATCTCCAQRRIDAANSERTKLEHRLNSQKAATARARQRR